MVVDWKEKAVSWRGLWCLLDNSADLFPCYAHLSSHIHCQCLQVTSLIYTNAQSNLRLSCLGTRHASTLISPCSRLC